MSLEDRLTNEEFRKVVAGVRSGEKSAAEKLTDYYNRGLIPADIYEDLMQQFGTAPKKKKRWWLF